MPSAAGFLADLRSLNLGNWFERLFLSFWASQERRRLQCYCQLQMLAMVLAACHRSNMMNIYCVTRCTKSGNSRTSHKIVAYLNCHNTQSHSGLSRVIYIYIHCNNYVLSLSIFKSYNSHLMILNCHLLGMQSSSLPRQDFARASELRRRESLGDPG